MRQLLPVFFFFCGFLSFGQNALLNQALSWFGKSDKPTIDSYLKNDHYQFNREKDSLDLHQMTYSLVETENGTQPVVHLLLSDTSLEFISVDTYGVQGQQAIVPILKIWRFKSIGTDINGNFITTTYDNGTFLIQEDYEAVGNPLGKGEIAYFRYRIFRKYGKFDTLNGEKIQFSEAGGKIVGNYKNGLLDGQRTLYFPNGTIKRTENYRQGRLNGTASDYDISGKLVHSSTHSYHWKYGMEKWYNNEGKLVKSLQWQRDLPVGTEKQTYNGKVVASIPYVKGMKQGLANVPVYFDPSIEAHYPLDTLNDEPIGMESVLYENGFKTGKAVCVRFREPDTLYVAYYKAGKLDSIYSKYASGKLLYTTTFSDGLENGTRVFRIPSGPLKDSIYRTESYQNGVLHGPVFAYYEAEKTDSELSWKKSYREENYTNGLRHGAFWYRLDSLNYQIEYYEHDQPHGRHAYESTSEGKHIRWLKQYEKGQRTGEWISENLTDSVRITQQFKNNRKQGEFSKTVNGSLIEVRVYESDTLREITFFEKNTDYQWYELAFFNNRKNIRVFTSSYQKQVATNLIYVLDTHDYEVSDTLLITVIDELKKIPNVSNYLNGGFITKASHYAIYGDYKNGKRDGSVVMEHYDAQVSEHMTYQNGKMLTNTYARFDNKEPYSGTFTAAESGEFISVKNGLRHGWCITYDSSKEEISRTKYVKGVAKKTIRKDSLPLQID